MTEDKKKEETVEETTGEVVEQEQSSAPQNFALRCPRCRWARMSSGVSSDLADLIYVKPNCMGCGKYRQYRCLKCGTACPLKRIKGNT